MSTSDLPLLNTPATSFFGNFSASRLTTPQLNLNDFTTLEQSMGFPESTSISTTAIVSSSSATLTSASHNQLPLAMQTIRGNSPSAFGEPVLKTPLTASHFGLLLSTTPVPQDNTYESILADLKPTPVLGSNLSQSLSACNINHQQQLQQPLLHPLLAPSSDLSSSSTFYNYYAPTATTTTTALLPPVPSKSAIHQRRDKSSVVATTATVTAAVDLPNNHDRMDLNPTTTTTSISNIRRSKRSAASRRPPYAAMENGEDLTHDEGTIMSTEDHDVPSNEDKDEDFKIDNSSQNTTTDDDEDFEEDTEMADDEVVTQHKKKAHHQQPQVRDMDVSVSAATAFGTAPTTTTTTSTPPPPPFQKRPRKGAARGGRPKRLSTNKRARTSELSSILAHMDDDLYDADVAREVSMTPEEEQDLLQQLKERQHDLDECHKYMAGLSALEKKRLRNRHASTVSRLKRKVYIGRLQRRWESATLQLNQCQTELQAARAEMAVLKANMDTNGYGSARDATAAALASASNSW